MDLAVGAKKVIIAMTHVSNDGECKIGCELTYPLTAPGVVDLIVTDLAVIAVTPQGLVLKEVAPGITPDQVQAVTGARLVIDPDVHEMQF
jgi:3-oxoacid CoA-transferase B subunit